MATAKGKTATKPAAKPAARQEAAKTVGTALATQGGNASNRVEGPLVIMGDQVPEHLQSAMNTNRGSEAVGTEDLVIPRLEIIQSVSPQVEPGNAEYIEAAKPGMMMNSVTKKLYRDGVYVVNIMYTKPYLVWRDRKVGGGFLGAFPSTDEAQVRINAAKAEGETAKLDIVDTPTHFCLLLDRDTNTMDEIMVPMPKTKAKVAREWNSRIKLGGGDRFARVYLLTTALEENAKGKFFNYVVSQSGFPPKPVYNRALALYEQVKSGKARTMDTTGYDQTLATEERTDM